MAASLPAEVVASTPSGEWAIPQDVLFPPTIHGDIAPVEPDAGAELPPGLPARRVASIRMCHSRSTLPLGRQSLSFALGQIVVPCTPSI